MVGFCSDDDDDDEEEKTVSQQDKSKICLCSPLKLQICTVH
jgi:hypothetical protein